jgi:excisionase family DNA binding protein
MTVNAALRGISPITIRRYIASGRLGAVRVGRGIRVSREAIDRFLTPVDGREPNEELAPVRVKPFTFDSPLWDIVGMIEGGPADFSEHADRYLADAYADPHDR